MSNNDERASLSALIAALDASPRALHREPLDGRNKSDGDEPPPYTISGKSGCIYADGDGFLLYVTTGESPRRWNNVKKRLPFCKVTHEADAIRDAIGIRRRRTMTAGSLLQLEAARNAANRASGDAMSI
jgi:hypothetical protein